MSCDALKLIVNNNDSNVTVWHHSRVQGDVYLHDWLELDVCRTPPIVYLMDENVRSSTKEELGRGRGDEN